MLDYLNVKQLGAVGDGNTDDGIAFRRAIRETSAGVFVPPGRYYLGQHTLELTKYVHLLGPNSGQIGLNPSVLLWDEDVTGIIGHRRETGGGTGDGCKVEGLALYSAGGELGHHGVWMRSRMTLRDITINGFGGNGVEIAASVRGDVSRLGNANVWKIDGARISGCLDGVHCVGGDANAGHGNDIDVTQNKRHGVNDESLHGNFWSGLHAARNGDRPYRSMNRNAPSVWSRCYYERGDKLPLFMSPALILGGEAAKAFEGDALGISGDGKISGALRFLNHGRFKVPRQLTMHLNGMPGALMLLAAERAGTWKVGAWHEGTGQWFITDKEASYPAIRLTSERNTTKAGRKSPLPAGKVLFADSLFLGQSLGHLRELSFGPMKEEDEHARGDLTFNHYPRRSGEVFAWRKLNTGEVERLYAAPPIPENRNVVLKPHPDPKEDRLVWVPLDKEGDEE